MLCAFLKCCPVLALLMLVESGVGAESKVEGARSYEVRLMRDETTSAATRMMLRAMEYRFGLAKDAATGVDGKKSVMVLQQPSRTEVVLALFVDDASAWPIRLSATPKGDRQYSLIKEALAKAVQRDFQAAQI